MVSSKRRLFTQGFSPQETEGVKPPGLVQKVRPLSSVVERSRHMRDVVGSTPTAATTHMTPIDLARFWSRVEVGRDFECWPWKGRKNDSGYGRFREYMAHRIACELVHGPIITGELALHSCDNPPCCNPSHLRAGGYQDNSDDATVRGRHATGERNGNCRLSDEQVEYIRANPDGMTGAAMARKFGVAESTISYIRRMQRRSKPVPSPHLSGANL